jgi:adenylate kinase family enzyme
VVHSPEAAKDAVLRRERAFYDAGKLCTSSWVFKIVSQAVQRIARSGGSVVFSGSPRTMSEAFGPEYSEAGTASKRMGGTVGLLGALYGKENITVVRLNVREASSLKRNSRRFICSVCGLPVLASSSARQCSFCEAPVRRRRDDSTAVIKDRLRTFKLTTYPLLAVLKKHGYRVYEVNGEPAPYKVHAQIVKALGLR